MGTGCFMSLLRDVVSVMRPRVDMSPGGSPKTPVYELVTGAVPCALQPVSSVLGPTLTGAAEAATHVAYMQPTDLACGDVLVEQVLVCTLGADAAEGDMQINLVSSDGLGAGIRLAIGDDSDCELATVSEVAGDAVGLCDPLVRGHESGSSVHAVATYAVVGVRDEAGVGHHLRAELRVQVS